SPTRPPPSGPPSSEFRRTEKPVLQLESRARKRLRRRPRLCKHCAALARRRNWLIRVPAHQPSRACPSMALGSRRFHCRSSSRLARKDACDEFLKPRITAKQVEPVINKYPA